MQVRGTVCVVTGDASGVGEALVRRFVSEGAARVLVADLAAVVGGQRHGARARRRGRDPAKGARADSR